MNPAARVGAFAALFCAGLYGAYAFLGRSMFEPKTQTFYADFADAAGVTQGAQVLLAGVNIGKVTQVELAQGLRARLTLAVKEGVSIPTGTKALLPTSLIGVGDRQIELTVPSGATGALPEKSVLQGELKSALAGLLPDTGPTLNELNKTLQATQSLLQDKELKGGIQKLMASSADTSEKFGQLASRLDAVLAQNQSSIRTMMTGMSRMIGKANGVASDLQVVSAQIAKYAKSGKLEGEADKIFAQVNQALETGNAMLKDMRALTNDPATQQNLKDIVANTRTMSESGTKIAANAEVLSSKGVILGDKAIEIATKASELADGAKELLEIFKSKLGGIGGGGKSLVGTVETSADLYRTVNPNVWRAEVKAVVPIRDQRLHLGLYDAFESNKLVLQLGKKYGKNSEVRGGIYAGKIGLGVDSQVAPQLFLSGNVYDLNRPRFDLRASTRLGKGLTGTIGLERIFEKNSPSIGIGIRR